MVFERERAKRKFNKRKSNNLFHIRNKKIVFFFQKKINFRKIFNTQRRKIYRVLVI
jgi:hypothetical protein